MALLRTNQLAWHKTSINGGTEILYTVPPARRAVVKEILIHAEQASDYLTLWVLNSGGSIQTYMFSAPVGSGEVKRLVFQTVLQSGDSIRATPATAGQNVLISGAELELE